MNKKILLLIMATISAQPREQIITPDFLSAIELENISEFTKKQQRSVDKIYNKWYSPVLRKATTSSKWPSVMAGKYANSRISKRHIKPFIKTYSINVEDIKKPISEFKSFNEFFTRELKVEARKISGHKNAVVSPADGSILLVQNVNKNTEFPIKGVTLSLEKLFKNQDLAKQFSGGTVIVIRLAPWDYHRFHFPVSGRPSKHNVINGKFESVHPSVYAKGIQPLEVNERHIIPHETDFGQIAIIPVGALFVGSIKYTYTPEKEHKIGQEMGYFEFGGSTVVLVFPKGKLRMNKNIIKNSLAGKETPVKMGQQIGAITR